MKVPVGDFRSTPQMIADVVSALANGTISYGPYSRALERDFAARHGSLFGVLSNSGTSSLQVALQAMKEVHGWKDGDEVIVPAATFVATVNVVLHNNMKPVLVDVEDGMWGLDPNLLEAAITPRTVAIIPVHPFGQPADMTAIQRIANQYDLKIIQDSCECVDCKADGMALGSFGGITCFSTYIAHIVTSGIGGLAITNNGEYAKVMRSLVNHGRDGIYTSPYEHGEGREVIQRRFQFERIGHSFRITELEAILATHALANISENIRIRCKNALFLRERITSDYQVMDSRPGTDHSWMMFPVVVRDLNRDGLTEYLESVGIETRPALPLTNQPVYKDMFQEDNYPVAKNLNRNGFYVGCHQYLTEQDMSYIASALWEYKPR